MKKLFTISVCMLVVLATVSSCKKDRPEPYDPYKQLEIDEELIMDYIADSIPAERHETGVYFVVLEPGSGETPEDQDVITVNYTGRILNGAKFETKDNADMRLGELINGWRIGLPLIKEGGRIRLIIPSGYGFGPYRSGSIPPNSILDFEIELLDVKN